LGSPFLGNTQNRGEGSTKRVRSEEAIAADFQANSAAKMEEVKPPDSSNE
jgi:hypothetical protein